MGHCPAAKQDARLRDLSDKIARATRKGNNLRLAKTKVTLSIVLNVANKICDHKHHMMNR